MFIRRTELSITQKLSSGDETPPIANVLLCAAIAYNLKKYIRFITNKRISVPMQLKKQALLTQHGLFSTIFYLKTLILHYNHKNIFEAV
ncbi:MAG: hypothetical protein IPJ79_06535 [Bacteroidetes bacterium]|nr:hypothetical protein [Bacteroidota bacterium]